MKRALLLNSTWEPLHFVSDVKAIVLLLKGRAELVTSMEGHPSNWDESFYAAGPVPGGPLREIKIPATLRLLKRVHKKWKPPRFRKKVLFNRDNWSCQYCSDPLVWDTITIEHIMPRSRGGQTTWKNCVSACRPCNKRKADRTPDEAGMKLLKQPTEPSALHFWDALRSNAWHDDWSQFIDRSR